MLGSYSRHSGVLACVAVAAVSAVPALMDLGSEARIVAAQLTGPAQGTDFLNLYAGASLMLHDPAHQYDLDVQLAVQRGLTGWQSPPVPFFLPPYGALLVAPLAALPYGIAYLVWLCLGVACLAAAAALLAPRWAGRWSPVVWLGVSLLYLPAFLGLAMGQTTAVMLLAFVVLCRFWKSGHAWLLACCVLVWLLKPQLALPLLAALLLSRRFDVLVRTLTLVFALSAAAVVRMGPAGVESYASLSRAKLAESFTADPMFLPGPTLLHSVHLLLGLNVAAHALGLLLIAAAWLLYLRAPERMRVPAIPIVATIAAPYALVHEMTAWLATFWLLWPYVPFRPRLLWLTAAIWLAADVGVALPLLGGAAVAAALGLLLLYEIQRVRGGMIATSTPEAKRASGDPFTAMPAAASSGPRPG